MLALQCSAPWTNRGNSSRRVDKLRGNRKATKSKNFPVAKTPTNEKIARENYVPVSRTLRRFLHSICSEKAPQKSRS